MSEEQTCRWQTLKDKFTVGDVAHLVCENLPKGSGFTLVAGNKPDYRVVLLDHENTADGIKATSYKPGDHKVDGLLLSHEGKLYRVQSLAFKVESVIESQQPTEPIPSYPPQDMLLPVSLMVSVLLTIGLAFGLSIWGIKQRRKQKIYLKDLRASEGYSAPYPHFHKTIRAAKEKSFTEAELQLVISGVEAALKIYFEQTIEKPVNFKRLGWLRRLLLRDKRNGESLFLFCQRRISELQRLKQMPSIKQKDVDQVIQEMANVVDRLEPYCTPLRGRK